MKKQLLFISMLLVSVAVFSQGGTVTGTIAGSESNEPLMGANIREVGTNNGAVTDFDGNFTLQVSSSSGTIEISYLGYVTTRKLFSLSNGNAQLGTVALEADADALDEIVIVGKGIIDLAHDRKTPIAVSTISSAEIQARAVGNVEFTEAMKNTPAVYVAGQAGGFGDSEMFLRGFDQTNTAFLLNGQPINGMEDGRMYWSNWSGMSDVANAVQVQRGLGSSKLAISSVGGTVNIVSKAAGRKEGGFVRMMTGNDSYMKGTMSYDSGLKGKWAYSFMLDHWQGHRKWANGTAGQGQNYFIGIGYVPNDKHALNFMITGAPQWHDQNFSVSMDDYDEFGLRHNNNSGFLDGERYTLRRNYYHKPVANLNWDFDISEKLDLSTVAYASWGRGGGTGPTGSGSSYLNQFRNDRNEINFDDIVQSNIDNNPSGYASFGDAVLRRMSVNNHNWYGVLSNLEINPDENFSFNIGVDGRMYNGHHWYQMNDLLGLQGYQDNFGYSSQRPADYVISETFEANPWASLFSFASEDQRFNYDYSEQINYIGGFGQAEYSIDKFSAFVQGAISSQSYQREGRADGSEINGVNGLGKSKQVSKMGFNAKGGLAYTLVEGHTLFANAGYYSRQPYLDNIFDDVRNSNYILEGENEVENEEITGFEAGYRLRRGAFSFDLNYYHTTWGNRFVPGAFIPGDGSNDPITGQDRYQRFTGVTQKHTGIEYEFRYRMGNRFMLRSIGSIGNWKYDGTTPVETRDAETNQLLDRRELNLTGTKIGQAAQTSFGFGFRYQIIENKLTIDADYNIYENLYGFVDASDVIDASLAGTSYQSEKLPSFTLLDAGITYLFEFGGERFTLRANVYNLANEIYLNQRDSFGYYFGNGRTWNASLRYDF